MMQQQKHSVDELIKMYGFTFSYECHCDGYATNVYKKGGYEIRYRKYNKPAFRVSKDRKVLKHWTPVLQFQEYLKTLFNVAV